MKNFIFVLTMLLFCGCSNGLEKKAKEHLNEWVEEFAHNPETFKLRKIDVVYSNDSVCIIHYIAKGENRLGGFTSSHMEYVFVRMRDESNNTFEYREANSNMDDDKSAAPVMDAAENLMVITKGQVKKADLIYLCATSKTLLAGRKVKE